MTVSEFSVTIVLLTAKKTLTGEKIANNFRAHPVFRGAYVTIKRPFPQSNRITDP